MLDFKEDFLQFIWQQKLLLPLPTITVFGKEIIILKPGELNSNSGPDFFNAQIKISNLVLAGNIEIHLKTSDWNKHGHNSDKNYNNIILHVVFEHDVTLKQNTDNNVEVLELKNLIDKSSIRKCQQLFESKQKLACKSQLKNCDDLKFLSWLDRMTIERLEEKIKRLEHWHTLTQGDYAQTFYYNLLRNFGFSVNADAFELLAKQLPISVLLKHSNNLLQLESLLLGTAGFLETQFQDTYILKLQNEFEFLKNKYNIIPLQKELFKFSRMRPANFPSLRLAQFAALINRLPEIFSKPHQNTDFKSLSAALNVPLEGYWKNHYKMDGQTTKLDLKMGNNAIENLMINSFAPFIFFYSKKTGNDSLSNKALHLLQSCAFEKNTVSNLFKDKMSVLKDAGNSQALINLYQHYCKTKQCLKCGVAAALLIRN